VGPTPERPVTSSARPARRPPAAGLVKHHACSNWDLRGSSARAAEVRRFAEELKKHTACTWQRSRRGSTRRIAGPLAKDHRIRGARTEAVRTIELEDFPVWAVNDHDRPRLLYRHPATVAQETSCSPRTCRSGRHLQRRRRRDVTLRGYPPRAATPRRPFFTNWHEYDAPAADEADGSLSGNRGESDVLRAQCCGHLGEPGMLTASSGGPRSGSRGPPPASHPH